MRIYTKAGDAGETGLLGGHKVRKDALRIEACGSLDELNAAIGLARAEPLPGDLDRLLANLQRDLFALGAEVAAIDPDAAGVVRPDAARIESLERDIDRLQGILPPLAWFILPAGSRGSAALHLARTICRRAERRIVALAFSEGQDLRHAMAYLNRLGDLLFVAARCANHAAGREDEPWRRPGPEPGSA